MATENDDVDLSLVVDSIKKASDRELVVLSEISAKLDGQLSSGPFIDEGTNSATPVTKQKKIPNKRPKKRTKATARAGEVTAQLAKKPMEDGEPQLSQLAAGEVMQPATSPIAIADSLKTATAGEKQAEKKPQPVIVEQGKVQKSTDKAPESVPVDVHVDQAPNDTSDMKKAIKDGFSAFDDYWKDERGRLRRGNGTYASKEENSRYQQSAEEIAKERQSEQQTSVIAKMIGAVKTIANPANDPAGNEATDAAGVAAGGSWFYATKELYQLGENVFKSVDGSIEKVSKLKNQFASAKAFSSKEFFSDDKQTQEAFTQTETPPKDATGSVTAINNPANSVTAIESQRDKEQSVEQSKTTNVTEKTPFMQRFGRSLLKAKLGPTLGHYASNVVFNKTGQSQTSNASQVENNTSTTHVAAPASMPSKVESKSESTSATERQTNTIDKRATNATTAKSSTTIQSALTTLGTALKIVKQPTAGNQRVKSQVGRTTATGKVVSGTGTGPDSLLNRTKQASAQSAQTEILREQSVDQKKSNETIISLLDEISTNSRSQGSGDGLLSSLGDMFGGRGHHRGARGRRGRAGRSVSVAKNAKKAGGIKSILSSAGKKSAGIAAGGLSMGGKAFKGISTLAKGAGKFVPFLAPVLAAYDAYSGFSDTEKQREVFNLKEGQEATTGQKTAMAAGNLLDMGGLVSGGAGLLGDVLGAVGFDGAKEALTFDSGDMAKGIYNLFGGSDDKATPASSVVTNNKTTKSNAQNVNVTTPGAVPVAPTKPGTAIPAKPSKVVDGMPVATVAAIGAGSASAVSAASHANANDASMPSVASTENTTNLQTANSVKKIQVNRSASSILADKSQRKLSEKSGPAVVRLDKKSVDDIAKGVKQANVELTMNLADSSKPPVNQQPGGIYAENSEASDIPSNFSDRSLQRQSADLE